MLANPRCVVSSSPTIFSGVTNDMPVTFDPATRDRTLGERALDVTAAATAFAGPCVSFEDDRRDDGGRDVVTIGMLAGRTVVIAWTLRGRGAYVSSMRKANDREPTRYAPALR